MKLSGKVVYVLTAGDASSGMIIAVRATLRKRG